MSGKLPISVINYLYGETGQLFVGHKGEREVTATYPEIVSDDPRLIVRRVGDIIAEWEKWSSEVANIVDQPYDRNTQSEVFKDGEDMMHKHEILQMKTLAFLNKNIKSHGFINGFDGTHCDRTDLRLKHRVKHRLQELRVLHACLQEVGTHSRNSTPPPALQTLESGWKQIENDYGVSKKTFGKKINFITDNFKRKIIFRDVEQAYILAQNDFNKPAVILSGAIIEELLRLYLSHKGSTPPKDNFDGYIQACQSDGLLKSAVHRLTDSVRQFRNFVHIEKEVSSRHTISKSTAKGAVASIFTLINDFH